MTQVTTLREFLDQAKPIIVGWLTERDSLSGGIGSGGGGGGGLSSHALDGVYHTGTLADSQAPQFLKTDGTRALTGNLSVDVGVTIDGVDISDFYTDYGNHITDGDIHVDHTTVSIIAGDGLTGGGDISASRTLNVVAGAGLGVAADEVYLSTPGTLSVSSSNSATGAHTHAITTSSNPGATAAILATNAGTGYIQLTRLGINKWPDYGLHVRHNVSPQLQLEYDATNYASFGVGAGGGLTITSYTDMALTPLGGDLIINGQVGIGLTPSYALHVEDTGTQLRLQYDASNYATTFVSSAGDMYTDITGILAFRGTDAAFTTYIRGNDNAFVHFQSNYDSGGVAQAGLVFSDYPTGTKWGLWKGTNDNLQLYDYSNTTYILNVASDGSMLWEPASTGVFQIRKGGEQLRLSYDGSNYTQFIVSNTGQLSIDATGDLIRVGASNDLETVNFSSHTLGWQITYDGLADFRHIWADELQVQAFTADVYQSIIGSIIVTPGRGRLSRNFQIPATSGSGTIYFEDMEEEGLLDTALFTAGDTIRLRYIDTSGGGLIVADVWGTVSSYNGLTPGDGEQSWLFTCTDDGGVSGSYIYAGSLALDYGVSGDGTWLATVTDTAGSPYSQVATWTTNPWTPGNWTVHTRIGNLDGIGTLGAEYGIWAGQGTTDNDSQIIMSDSTAEIRNLDLYVTTGGVTKVIASTSGFISAGNVAPTDYATATQAGFWAGDDSGTPKLWLGDRDGEVIVWDGSALYIKADSYNYIRTNGQDLEFYAGASSSTRTIWVDGSAGDAYFGSTSGPNVWIDGDGGVKIRQGSTEYIRLLTNGDAYFGREVAGKSNIFWDESSGILYFRSNTTNRAYVDANGYIWASSGTARLDDTGFTVDCSVGGYGTNYSYKFKYGSTIIGALYGDKDTLDDDVSMYLKVDPPGAGQAHFLLRAEGGGTSPYGPGWVMLEATSGGQAMQFEMYNALGVLADSYFGFWGDVAVVMDDDLLVENGITIGQSNRAYRPTANSLWLYNGTTRMGELSYSDTTWFRINQNTAKDIYTPRNMAVAGAFSVGTSNLNSAGDLRVVNDINAGGGLYVGSETTDPATGAIRATGNLSVISVYSGSSSTTTSTGYVEASSHVVANGNFFGRSSDHYFKTSVNIGYASDVDSNRFKLLNESVNYRIEKAYAGTCILWFNWIGNGAGTRTTRCANGNGGYGNIHADNFVNESRRASKTNIRPLRDEVRALDIIESINTVAFEKPNSGSRPDQRRMGMVAEDLAEILPEVVAFDYDTGEPEGIDYGQMVPLLINAIKELREELNNVRV